MKLWASGVGRMAWRRKHVFRFGRPSTCVLVGVGGKRGGRDGIVEEWRRAAWKDMLGWGGENDFFDCQRLDEMCSGWGGVAGWKVL